MLSLVLCLQLKPNSRGGSTYCRHNVFPIQMNRTAPFHMIIIINRELCISTDKSFPHIHVAILGKHSEDVFFESILPVPCKLSASCFYKLLMFSSCFNLIFFEVDIELGSPFLQEMLAFHDIQDFLLSYFRERNNTHKTHPFFLPLPPKYKADVL